MTTSSATSILMLLVDGIDPITGEVFPDDHVLNKPQVICALHTAILSLQNHEPAVPPAKENPSYVRKNGKLNAGRPWTEEDRLELKHLYQNQISIEEICCQLQRRERGVTKQLKHLGLLIDPNKPRQTIPGLERAGQPWTRDEDNRLRTLHANHWQISDIAHEMQRSEYAIFCRMERLELHREEFGYPCKAQSPFSNYTAQKALRAMYNDGHSIAEIAAHFSCSEKLVSTHLYYMGLTKSLPFSILKKE